MKKLLALLAAFLCTVASAGQITVTWTMPSLNTDGSSIPATGPLALKSTHIEYVTCADAASVVWPAVPNFIDVIAPATSQVVALLTEGVTYCVRARVTNNALTDSAFAGPVSKTISVTIPKAPGNVTVATIEPAAYKQRMLIGSYTVVVYGTVPVGTPCDATHSIDGYNVIPRDVVVMLSPQDSKPIFALGKCG